jgi:hypothetical protein
MESMYWEGADHTQLSGELPLQQDKEIGGVGGVRVGSGE